jgi:hypothetical protein
LRLTTFVEDELLLRMDSAEVIEAAGFEVIQGGQCRRSKAPLGKQGS